MPWSFIIPAAAALIGAGAQSKATKQAASTTAAASDRAADVQRQMFERQVELQEPWRQAGVNALAKLQGAADYTPFGPQQFQADPGYAFRMSEGMKALERSAAARGGLLSGAMMKGAQQYGQNLASQEYQNAFNRYQAERQARLGPLQSLAGVGQTAAQTLGGAASQYGTNIGNMMLGQGQIAGQAAIARGSAYGGALNQLGELAGRYFARPTASSSAGPSYMPGYYGEAGADYMGR